MMNSDRILSKNYRKMPARVSGKSGANLMSLRERSANRVKSLINSDTMKISAIPNPEKLGLNFICVICIEVKVGSAEKVEQMLIKSPNVYYLCGCTGTYDIIGLLMFRAPHDFDEFVKDVIAKIPEITRTSTFVVMHVSRSPWEHNIDVSALGKS